ncbi:hypothetical protein DIQ65_17125, partial [Acinetobacter baumannii]|nr:hypothetical protein [Acinetobacter baumannii]
SSFENYIAEEALKNSFVQQSLFQLILVFFFGDNKVTTNICMTLAFLVLMVEFWLIYRASYIKTFEQRNFFQAAKDSLIELRLGLKMILKK